MDWDFFSPHRLRPYKTLGGVASNNSGCRRLDGDVGGYVRRQITGARIQQKLNKMRLLLGPILGKMLPLLLFLYITPTVSFATLSEPILKMAVLQIIDTPRLSSEAPAVSLTTRQSYGESDCRAIVPLLCLSVTLTDNSWKPSLPPKLIMQVKFNHKRKGPHYLAAVAWF